MSAVQALGRTGCENNVELCITRELPNLVDISISDCEIDDATVAAVARSCPNLRKFDISGSSQVSAHSILMLSGCRQLQSLSFGDIGGADSANDMMGSESGSESGQASALVTIRDEHIESLALNTPNLQDIEITGCCNVTGRAVSDLLIHCPQLRKLSLVSCDAFVNCAIPANAFFHNLQALQLQNCGYTTDSAVRTLVQRCPELSDLNLYGCYSLSDEAVNMVDTPHDECATQLQCVNLGNCNTGDASVCRISKSAKLLRVLICGEEHQTAEQARRSPLTDEAVAR
eukprot:SAG31_NODE_4464_length_3212_cov_1.240283_3_plen_287_part_00